jgi:hypothetical protein
MTRHRHAVRTLRTIFITITPSRSERAAGSLSCPARPVLLILTEITFCF